MPPKDLTLQSYRYGAAVRPPGSRPGKAVKDSVPAASSTERIVQETPSGGGVEGIPRLFENGVSVCRRDFCPFVAEIAAA